MRYCVSDLHGEYELFMKLLDRISFSSDDEMYICGDIIDKGKSSVRLAKYISKQDNMHCILGNHEHAFLNYYHALLSRSPDDFDEALRELSRYFPGEEELLDWELVDWLDGLPPYIEEEDFICVHAGIPIGDDGKLMPLSEVSINQLVNDRRFKEPTSVHTSPRCVFFGHTETSCVSGEHKILGYRRNKRAATDSIKYFYKIHMDTGTWSNGVLGCFCIDTCKVTYARK